MARNNNRRRNKNKNPNNSTTPQPASPKKEEKPAKIRTNERGVFEFSDADLTEDTGLKVVSRNTGETKYASFEDFLKDQN